MRKIFCIGEMLIDLVAETSFDKAKTFGKNPGGAPANVAAQIAKLGQNVAFLGNIGNDSFGNFLVNTLHDLNINDAYISRYGKTTLAFVQLDNHGERDFEFYRGHDDEYKLPHQLSQQITHKDIIHFGSATALLGGNLYNSYFQLLDIALDKNAFISFDPNFRDNLISQASIEEYVIDCKKIISCANLVKMNELELQLISGEDDIDLAIKAISQITNAITIITLGAEGSILVQDNQAIPIASRHTKQVDSTGAGDAFVGTVLAQIAQTPEKPWEEIITIANFAGSYTCQKHGAIPAMPNMEQLMSYINA